MTGGEVPVGGIYLPLITTNCAMLGLVLFQTSRDYNFLPCLAFAPGNGTGFTPALSIMSGISMDS
jgi:electron transport complex protein RnfA